MDTKLQFGAFGNPNDNKLPEVKIESLGSSVRDQPKRTEIQGESPEGSEAGGSIPETESGDEGRSRADGDIMEEGSDSGLVSTNVPKINGEKRSNIDGKGRFVKGNPGGPGRPPGSLSIKDLVRQHLLDPNNKEDLKKFVEHFIKKNRELAWQMLEGRPQQDVTSAGEAIKPVPILSITNVSTDNRNEEATEIDEADTGGSGGDIGRQDSSDRTLIGSLSPAGSDSDSDKRSIGELASSETGSDEGLPERNGGASVLSG